MSMRTKHTFRLPPDLAAKLADYAARKRVPQALIVEAALASHLSPDGADRLEAALARRLDRMTRQMELIERHVTISNEALAVFVRFWLTTTPALPGLTEIDVKVWATTTWHWLVTESPPASVAVAVSRYVPACEKVTVVPCELLVPLVEKTGEVAPDGRLVAVQV